MNNEYTEQEKRYHKEEEQGLRDYLLTELKGQHRIAMVKLVLVLEHKLRECREANNDEDGA